MIPNCNKVPPVNVCDVCKDKKASYYNLTYYIHVCSTPCWEKFLKGYNIEIDEIALEVKNAKDLGKKDKKDAK